MLHPIRSIPVLLTPLLGLALLPSLGCATIASRVPLDQPALLVSTADYELHLVDGRVRVVDRGDAVAQPREVRSYEEFRDLYRVRKDTTLPAEQPHDGVTVNGWGGLDCVRKGIACGREAQDPPAHDVIRLQLRFPQARAAEGW